MFKVMFEVILNKTLIENISLKNLKFIRHSFQTLEAVARRCSVRKGVFRNFARPAILLKKTLT